MTILFRILNPLVMKYLFLFTFLIFVFKTIEAQTSRIALVKPNGNTTIHSTLPAAYSAATDDDFIYLPGGHFEGIGINKRIHIIGAGSNIDSSAATGITKISSLVIYEGGAGGSVQGIYFYPSGSSNINFHYSNPPLTAPNYYEINSCYIGSGVGGSSGNPWEGLVLKNNVIGVFYFSSNFQSIKGGFSNCFLKNNIILGNIETPYSTISNNIFFASIINVSNYSNFNNNIFQQTSIQTSYSIFHNNVNAANLSYTNEVYNNINEPWVNIFENPGMGSGTPITFSYDVHNDYHVKSTSACKNSGTDGNDRGIYGGSSPWVEGSIPSNPHIYFKNVAEETNASGQLQIHFKVRTN